MGMVKQFQRRAIESLHLDPLAVSPDLSEVQRGIVDTRGVPLHVAGVSEGIGTCSDIHGLDVLILTDRQVEARKRRIGLAPNLGYAVLLRNLTEEERATDTLSQEGMARACVELLFKREFVEPEGPIIFEQSGKTAFYTKVI